ncbi:hypothetical protein PC113_g15700 [Phytophthora cactorum]|uniref:HECT-type E3 ubiquitin transferase n=2 Tax=Phytophthora cactorum TaxID=29920 RepID=A0A8T0YGG1_9STRA|nr:hypothetical protein PC113_g15700 [Phytophthora cactorum]
MLVLVISEQELSYDRLTENVPGIFSVRFRFCVICGEKLKLSPTERARAIRPLTSRQLRARRRTEWQRKLNCGEASWHRDPGQDCPQYPGLVTELVIDPSLGVFVCTNHEAQTYFFNVNSKQWIGEEHLAYYFAFGRLVGRALLEGEVMGFHFASALLKVILGIPITFRDYEDLDPVTYKSVKWMLEHNGADKLGLDFTATRRDAVGNLVTVELVPSGGNISVTDENKHEFAERWLRYFLLEAFQISCTCF